MEQTNGTGETNGAEHHGETEPYTDTLRCTLTDREIVERAQRLETIKSKKLKIKADAKAEISKLEAEVEELSAEVRDGMADKPVSCERRFIYRIGLVQEVRLDTGEVLHERAMESYERQPNLPGVDDPEDDSDDDAPSDRTGLTNWTPDETEDPDERETAQAGGDDLPPADGEPELETEKRGRGRRRKPAQASQEAE